MLLQAAVCGLWTLAIDLHAWQGVNNRVYTLWSKTLAALGFRGLGGKGRGRRGGYEAVRGECGGPGDLEEGDMGEGGQQSEGQHEDEDVREERLAVMEGGDDEGVVSGE